MATFTYRAANDEPAIVTGKMQANSEHDLLRKLSTQGLTLIEAEKARDINLNEIFKPAFREQDLLDFTYLLKLVITSGIPLLVGLDDVQRVHGNKKLQNLTQTLRSGIESGLAISEAMQEYPEYFPNYYIQMIRAGELSGTLEKSLAYLLDYIEWQINFKKLVRSAFVYPSIILSIVGLLVGLLFTFVFPSLAKVLKGLRVDLPLPTKILISLSDFAREYFLPVVIIFALAVVFYKLWKQTDPGRKMVDGFVLRLPRIGDLIAKVNLSRYFRTLAILHASGLNVEQSFSIAAESVGNTVLAEKLGKITGEILDGATISQAMQSSGVIQEFVIHMVALGEKTGDLDGCLMRATDIFDKEVPETIKKVFAYLEPLIMVLLGGIVLMVLLSIFLPIYKLVGSIKVR
jgi:type II secretory pathway component PulF